MLFNIIKKNRVWFAAERNGYKCKILIDENSEHLTLGEHNLIVEDISVYTDHGVTLRFKLSLDAKIQTNAGSCTLKHFAYNSEFVKRCKAINGEWDGEDKIWRFSGLVRDKVDEIDALFNSPLYTVEIKWYANKYLDTGYFCLFGYSLFFLKSRRSLPVFCDGVELIDGEIGKDSFKAVRIADGATIRMQIPRGVYSSMLEYVLDNYCVTVKRISND